MAPPNTPSPAAAETAHGAQKSDRRAGPIAARDTSHCESIQARALDRLKAWCRILDAVADMRRALEYRIWREDPDDKQLEADVRVFCELARALADFLKARSP